MTELILIGWLAGVSVFTAVDSEVEQLVQSNEDKALVELSQALPQSEETIAVVDAELDGDTVAQK